MLDRLTQAIIRRLVPAREQLPEQAFRARIGYIEAWASIISNIILAAAKFAFGLVLNSISLLADAVHTASDVITSVVVLLGFKAASLPADEEHPFGHARVESIATLIIAVLLGVVGFEFASGSVKRFLSGEVVRGSLLVAVVLVAGGVFKEWLARFSEQLGRHINSSTLIADAWHHRSDAIASVMVAIAMVASRFGYHKVDAVLGLVVSALIIFTGWQLGKEAASALIGKCADEELIERIRTTVSSVNGVDGVHGIALHDYGAGRSVVSLHVEVDQTLRVDESHSIAEEVESILGDSLKLRATVHIEPVAQG